MVSVDALGSATAVLVPSAPCFAAQTKMLQGGGCWCASVLAAVLGTPVTRGDGCAGRDQLEGRMCLSTCISPELSEE